MIWANQFFKIIGVKPILSISSIYDESKNFQFVKNTKFSKFSQNLCFYFRDLRSNKILPKESSTQILAGIGDPSQ
jgi:hypothetical protein